MHDELSPVEKVLDRLEDYKVRKDEYRARCPAHNGNSDDSLSIKEGDDGRALLICHAQCEIEDVLEALDLSMTDLFVQGNSHGSPGAAKKAKKAPGSGNEKHKILTTDELPTARTGNSYLLRERSSTSSVTSASITGRQGRTGG